MQTIFREPVSGFTHLAGAVLAIVALCILTVRAALYGNIWHMVSFSVFGVTMLLMFTSSAVYHLSHGSERLLMHLKRLDHMAIFLMIAGTYTPVCLIGLDSPLGNWLCGAVWALAIAGVLMKALWISAPRWLSTLVYVLMGWMVVAAGPQLLEIPGQTLHWLVAGGIFYTLGALIYATRWPDPLPGLFGYHEIWHLFVLAGVFCHFWSIAFGLASPELMELPL
ncbi:PAQR family membrane homeostasis protein TrhA [Parathalassolituus penaei]|uniref:Hemolysin III family protein n=1 Tax=Parathalassolituus penaei TaxID=2997323 RepID=A0A9X3EAV9_9GAMM|nr:hemolysin III family protein [Parathalassolituus penaei]MCY0963806.1 hemolysin III family protein [Parathalassolituus penaei]